MGLFLDDEEAQDVKELIAEVKAARAERQKEKENNGLTKEKIMAEKNMTRRQQLIRENMHLFAGCMPGGTEKK